ncbi:MAG TPA: HAD family phosphatase [Candidatus Limnocylindrales bacterium]|nr:HAD family phosphatase [Candidatus Limnocylindrales bacterium]
MTGDGLSPLPDPAALLFDLDGTLVDTVETRIRAWLDVFREEGIRATREQVAPLIGSDGKRLAKEISALAGRALDDEAAERVDKHSGEIYDRLNTDPRPLPAVRELLRSLAGARPRWAVATSSRREQVKRSLDSLGLPSEPRVVDGSHVEEAKPAPDLLLLAARELDVPPAACWYVGDSTWDMAAALAAGMIPIGVTTGAVDRSALVGSGAAVALDSLEPLLHELRRRRLVRG